ncbi:MAG: beta strand repeat-containing protein [Ilumatobacteraceae bacterium]
MENHLGRSYGIETPGLQATGITAATVDGQTDRLTVSWTDPTDVTPTSYTIEQSDDAGSTWSTATTSGTVSAAGTTVTGLTSSDSYLFRVTPLYANVTNERASTPSASASPLTATATALTWSPASPTDAQTITLTATVADSGSAVANASVAFAADSTPITGCEAKTTDTNGEATCSWTPGSAATYSVTATTTGSGLISSTDTQSITVSTSTPGQPTGLTVVPSGSTATEIVLSWTSPLSGSTPTDYKIEYSTNGGSTWTTFTDGVSTATSAPVTGLVANRYYTFRVTAIAGGASGEPSTSTSTTSGLIPFPNDTIVGGSNAPPGFSYLYEEVLPGVDARLTVTQVTVSGDGRLEVDTTALDSVFTDGNFINTRLVRSDSHHHATYRVDFVDSSSGDPVTLENLFISVKDLDGGSGTASSEYLEVAGITGYTLHTAADIEVTQPTAGAYRFRGTAQQPGASYEEGWAQVTYDRVSSVTLTVGNTTGVGARIPIAFGPVGFSSSTTTDVPRQTYTITYDANGGTGSLPSPTAGTSALTIADGSALTLGSRSFLRWNTSSEGTGTSFSSGASYTPSSNLTLYAFYQQDPGITWSPTTTAVITDSPITPDSTPSFSGGGTLTYSIVNAGNTGCSVDSSNGVLTFTSAGSCIVRASTSANGDYIAGSLDVTFTISKVTQLITFADPVDRTWSASTFDLSPTTDATGLTVTLASGTSDVCTVSGLTVTMLTAGTCTLTASQAGNSTYAAATDVTQSFDIATATQTITFNPTFPTTTYGDDPFSIAGTSSSDLVLSYSSTTPTVCTVAGDASLSNGATNAVVSPVGAGTCTIVSSQAGDNRYAAATDVSRSFTVGKAAQPALAFTSSATAVWGDEVTATVSGGSGAGAITFTASTGTAGCAVNATTGVVTFTSAGTCSLTANKAGDTNRLDAIPVSQTLTIATAAQTVTFTSTVPANPRPGGTYTPTASATSGLVPAFSITAGQTTVCTLSSGVVTFIATGVCTIAASQVGDSQFAAAAAQSQTINVGSLNQSITVTTPDDVTFGSPSFTLDTDASSGLTVTVTASDTDLCSVSGYIITPVDIGECELTLTQAGDSRYSPASSVTIAFRIVPARPTAPTITSVSAGNANATVAFSAPGFTGGVDLTPYTITATPTSGTAISETGCAASPCTIGGLANGTEYTLTVIANNIAGAGPASVASPAVTPATRATAVTTLAATPGNGTLRVTWGAPADFGGGTFTRYELRIAPNGESMPQVASASVTSSTSGSYTFTGLNNGTAYNVEVVTITSANLAAITGNTTSLASVPLAAPGAPTALAVNELTPQVIQITWSEPTRDGGTAVTGYTVTITDGDGASIECGTITIDSANRSANCTSEPLEVSSEYTISVGAVNRIGNGPTTSITHTTPTFTAPTSPPVTGDTDNCPCVYDDDGNAIPATIETTPTGQSPGSVTLNDGTSVIGIGGTSGAGNEAQTWTDPDGNLVAQTPGIIPLTGSGALPGTTVTIFFDGVAMGTGTVDLDGNWRIDLTLPEGTNGPGDLAIMWIDENGQQRTVTSPLTIIASGEAATAPRSPNDGQAIAVDPDSAIAIGPNGELIEAVRSIDADNNTITVTAGGTTITLSPEENGQLAANGRLILTHPSRVRVTATGMLPNASATIWIKSTPQRLGSSTVSLTGTLDTTYTIPSNIDPGNHTIQIDTADPQGRPLSIAVGLSISTGTLPVTGANSSDVLAWLTLVIALGGLLVLTTGSRRRLNTL